MPVIIFNIGPREPRDYRGTAGAFFCPVIRLFARVLFVRAGLVRRTRHCNCTDAYECRANVIQKKPGNRETPPSPPGIAGNSTSFGRGHQSALLPTHHPTTRTPVGAVARCLAASPGPPFALVGSYCRYCAGSYSYSSPDAVGLSSEILPDQGTSPSM